MTSRLNRFHLRLRGSTSNLWIRHLLRTSTPSEDQPSSSRLYFGGKKNGRSGKKKEEVRVGIRSFKIDLCLAHQQLLIDERTFQNDE